MTQDIKPAAPSDRLDEWEAHASNFPEINPSNYGHDDTCNLNDWGCQAAEAIPALIGMVRELEKAIDGTETNSGVSDNGSLWRFWREGQRAALVRAIVAEAERDEARAQTSQVAKVLAWEPPYQAGLHKRVEAIIHRAEVAEARATAEKDRMKELEKERPLTAAQLADALGAFWNGAINEAHNRQSGMDAAAVMAEGFRAVQNRIEEYAKEGADAGRPG